MRVLPLALAAWSFRDATRRSPWRAAVVPGCVHRDLLRHRLIPDPFWGTNELDLRWIEERDWEYRAAFTVPQALLDEEAVELVVDGLDTVATVLLNGREAGRAENMFLGHRWEVKPLLRPGKNELLIRLGSAMEYIRTHRTGHRPREINDPVGGCTIIRKQQCQFGWDWGPRFVTAGIWRDLRLEGWTGNRLDGVRVTQDSLRRRRQRGAAVRARARPPRFRRDRARHRFPRWPRRCHHREPGSENRKSKALVAERPGRATALPARGRCDGDGRRACWAGGRGGSDCARSPSTGTPTSGVNRSSSSSTAGPSSPRAPTGFPPTVSSRA